MSGGRFPKRIVFGNLEGAMRKVRGGKEKGWIDCAQSDVRVFRIAGDWKATALEAGVCFDTVAEVGRIFMAREGKKRKTRVGIDRRRERQTRLGKLSSNREA